MIHTAIVARVHNSTGPMFLIAARAATARAPAETPLERVTTAAFALVTSLLILLAHEPGQISVAADAGPHASLLDRGAPRALFVAGGTLQVGLIILMFRGCAAWTGATAAVATTALTAAGAPLSTAEQFGLSGAIVLASALALIPSGSGVRLPTAGALVAAIALVQPFAGLVLAIAAAAYALLEAPRDRRARHGVPGPIALSAMLAGLGLCIAAAPAASLLYGAMPMAVLGYALFRVRAPGGAVCAMIAQISAGAVLLLGTAIAFHLAGSSLPPSFGTSVVTGVAHIIADGGIDRLGTVLLEAAHAAADKGAVPLSHGWFGMLAALLPLLAGIWVLTDLARRNRWSSLPHPLPFVAIFYPVAAVLGSAPFVLIGSVAVSAILLLADDRGAWVTSAVRLGAAALSIAMLAQQAT